MTPPRFPNDSLNVEDPFGVAGRVQEAAGDFNAEDPFGVAGPTLPTTAIGIQSAEAQNRAENVAKLEELLQRPDLTPEHRARIQTLISRTRDPLLTNQVENNRTPGSNLLRGVGRSIADAPMGVADLTLRAADWLIPGDPRLRDLTAEGLAASKQMFDPEGKEGTLGYVAGFLLAPAAAEATLGRLAGTSRMAAYGTAALNPYGRAVGVSADMARRLPLIGEQVQLLYQAATKPGATLATRVAAQAVGSMGMDGLDLVMVATDPDLTEEERNQRMALTILGSVGGNVAPEVLSALAGKVRGKPFAGHEGVDNPFGLPNREATASKPEEMMTREELERQLREGNEMVQRARSADKRSKLRNRWAKNAKRIWEAANLDKSWKRLSATERDRITNEYIAGLPDSVRKEYDDLAKPQEPSATQPPPADAPRATQEPPKAGPKAEPKAGQSQRTREPHSPTQPPPESPYHTQFDPRVRRFVELTGNMTLPNEKGEPRFIDYTELDKLFKEVKDAGLGGQVQAAFEHPDQPWSKQNNQFIHAWATGVAQSRMTSLAKRYGIDLSKQPPVEPWPQGQLGPGQKLIGGQRSESQTGINPIPPGQMPRDRVWSLDDIAKRGAYSVWRTYPAEKRSLIFTNIAQSILDKNWENLNEGEMELITNFMKQAVGIEGEARAAEGRVVGSIGPTRDPATPAPDATASSIGEAPAEPSPTPSPTSPPPTGEVADLQGQLASERERRVTAERDAYSDNKTGTGNANLFARRLGLESPEDINHAMAAPGKTILLADAKHLGFANEKPRSQLLGDQYLISIARAGRQALNEVVPDLVQSGQAQLHRVGGDEFGVLGLTPEQAEQVGKRWSEILGSPELGTYGKQKVTGGIYFGHDPSYATAADHLANVKATDPLRLKNIMSKQMADATPPAPKRPKVEPIKRTDNEIAVDLTDVKTEKGLDRVEAQLDKMYDKGQITEQQWAREVNKIMEARGSLRGSQAKPEGFDRAAVRTVDTTKPTEAQRKAGPETRRRDNTGMIQDAKDEAKQAKADFNRRYRSPIKGMNDADLKAHIGELNDVLLGKPKPKGLDQFAAERSRLSDAMEEQARRAEPPSDPTGNAPGVFLRTPPEVVGAAFGAAWGWWTGPEDDEQARLENSARWAAFGAGGLYALRVLNRTRNTVKLLPGQEKVRKVVVSETDTPKIEKTHGFMTTMMRQYAAYVRRSQPIETAFNEVAGANTSYGRSAAKQAELFGLSQSQADQAILGDGVYTIGPDGQLVQFYDKSLRNIAEGVGGDMRTVGDIAAAGRTLELAQQAKPRKTPINLEDAAELWMSRPPAFEKARQQLREFNLAVARMGEWSGLLRPGTADMWASEELYAPMMKALDYVGEMIDTKKRRASGTGTGQPFKKLRGGALPIKNPVDASIEFTHTVYRRSEFNRVARTFFDQMRNASVEDREILGMREVNFLRPEEGDLDSLIMEGSDEVAKVLQQDMAANGQNISQERAKYLTEMFASDLLNYKGDVVVYYDKGEKIAWRVNPEVARAFKVLRPAELEAMLHSTGMIRGLAEGTAKIARVGITANPVFVAFQAFRDVFQFYMNGAHSNPEIAGMSGFSGAVAKAVDAPIALGSSAIYSMLGMAHQLLNTKKFREFVQAGGGHDSIAGQGLRQSRDTGDYLNALKVKPGSNPLSQAFQNVKEMQFKDAYGALITPVADAGRVGAYLKARGRGESVGDAVWAAKVTGANYSQRGNSLQLQALNRMTLFLNPSLQGMDASLNAMKRDPGGWIMRGMVGIALPSIYLWYANKDDQEIQDLRRTPAGRRYWFTRVNDEIVRIPKPVLDGQIFGSTFETILDRALANDPIAIETQAQALSQDATLHLLPLIGAIPASLLMNQDWNTGMPIVSEGAGALEPEYQANSNSSVVARTISRNVAPWLRGTGIDMQVARTVISPSGIDYIVNNLGGGLAREALRAVTAYSKMEQNGVQPTKDELPFVASVYPKSPTTASGPVYEFYRAAGRAERVSRTVTYRSRYDTEGLDTYIEENAQWLAINKIVLEHRAAMVDLRKAIGDLQEAPNDLFSNPRDRQDQIDNITFQIVELARNANLAIREINSQAAQIAQP